MLRPGGPFGSKYSIMICSPRAFAVNILVYIPGSFLLVTSVDGSNLAHPIQGEYWA